MAYTFPGIPATPGLPLNRAASGEWLTEKIRRNGPVSFADFMAEALYHPVNGYYARDHGQVGRKGDFYTSVSTGPVFGRLLAEKIAQWHAATGAPKHWRVVELGAHDASLALDLLAGLEELGIADGCEYEILEPLENLAAIQDRRIRNAGVRARIHPSPATLENNPLPTYLLANEVLDALPCHLVEAKRGGWREVGVEAEAGLAWCDLGTADSVITADLSPQADGYRTEVRPRLGEFFAPLVRLLNPGRMLWIDYGFAHSAYYDPARTTGTLRTYRQHQAGENPLEEPGFQDITAHVNFTAAARAILHLGGAITLFESQSTVLTRLAAPWLLAREGKIDSATRKELLAFQTLIHPAHLGSRFHFLEASFNSGDADDARALHRLEIP